MKIPTRSSLVVFQFILGCVLASQALSATTTPPAVSVAKQNLAKIQSFLTRTEDKIDLTRVKLTIDQMIDPSVDIEKSVTQINTMAANVKKMLPQMRVFKTRC